MSIADKAALTAKRADTPTGFPEATVQIPGKGEVRVRGLSRFEMLHVQQNNKGMAAIERATLALALIEPAMTEAEVGAWQKVSDGTELEMLTYVVSKLTGVLPSQRKAIYAQFEDDPGSEFRILPGAEAVDDSGQAPAGDA